MPIKNLFGYQESDYIIERAVLSPLHTVKFFSPSVVSINVYQNTKHTGPYNVLRLRQDPDGSWIATFNSCPVTMAAGAKFAKLYVPEIDRVRESIRVLSQLEKG